MLLSTVKSGLHTTGEVQSRNACNFVDKQRLDNYPSRNNDTLSNKVVQVYISHIYPTL